HVCADRDTLSAYQANVGASTREISMVLRPENSEQVRRIVAIANERRVPLYPISRGCNWGLGSRLPVRDGCAVVDLSRMNKIISVDAKHAYAVIEPGVTQGQLYDHLVAEEIPLMLNVTGAGRQASLVGNALERGIGYFSSRADSLSGMEVVLGNGDVIRTGFGHFESAHTTHLYRHGIGPSLDGIFGQSNFGIVTQAGIELLPKPAHQMACIAGLADSACLGRLVDALGDLRRQGLITSVVHIGNRARTHVTLTPLVMDYLRERGETGDASLAEAAKDIMYRENFGSWSAVIGMHGTRGQLAESQKWIRRKLRGIARADFITDANLAMVTKVSKAMSFLPVFRRKLAVLHAVTPLHNLTSGIPTDAPLKSVYFGANEAVPDDPAANPDASDAGLIFVAPFIPLCGRTAVNVVALTERIFNAHRFTPYITLNIIDAKSAEAVINVAFRRSDTARVEAARQCVAELETALIKQGYPPYRVGPDSMPRVVSDNSFWRTVGKLKSALDPNGIIAPGRYEL
ncbi:MAG: 4-cresol dehydrogenase (hydroxylating), partial [Rhodothermales bacterium]